jgi:hypothetical protein
VNTTIRAIAALATITLLSVDDVEGRKADMNESKQEKPRGIDPVPWAEYNASQSRTLAEISGLPPPEPVVFELAPYEAGDPLGDLLLAMDRAASELHGSSPKGDRIAQQLIEARARFHLLTGLP